MRFLVNHRCGSSGARVGVLFAGNSTTPVETPALLLSTKKGLPAFISRDLLASLPFPGPHPLHISPIHFFDGPTPTIISSIGGLHQISALQNCVFVASARDSIESLPESVAANKLGASFETPGGRRLVKPSNYMEIISSLKPDFWASLADEVPAWVSEKRNKASVDRTLRWLDDCIALDKTGGNNIFGAIVGGSSVEERKRCAAEVAKKNVRGFYVGGFGLGESMNERPDLLNTIMDSLPEEKPRQISGLALPEEVLQGVAAGIDLFESTYVYHLTLGGLALVFPLDILEEEIFNTQLHNFGDITKINLRATAYSSNGNIAGYNRNYKGVRCRKEGKWVSEIRVPGSRERLWLGTYRSPMAAAVAHDTAFFLLRGPSSSKALNFPDRAANMTWVNLSPRSVQRVASESGMDFDAKLIIQSPDVYERDESSNGVDFDGGLSYAGYGDISVEDMEILM